MNLMRACAAGRVLLLAVSLVVLSALSGCSEPASSVAVTSGASAEWPSASLGDVIREPTFATKPSEVCDCGSYVTVSYADLPTEDLLAYVDGLEADPDFFVVYDEREPVVSCSLSDRRGNSVTISQVDGMTEAIRRKTSISVVMV